jgi:hypothetical protein
VESSKIFVEGLSATTEENAEFALALLRRTPAFQQVQSVGILTLLYHMERALPVFRSAYKREGIKRKAFAEAGIEDSVQGGRFTVRPDLRINGVFAETLLADSDPSQIDKICQYYTTPKGGKQYNVNQMRKLLTEGKSLYEMMS